MLIHEDVYECMITELGNRKAIGTTMTFTEAFAEDIKQCFHEIKELNKIGGLGFFNEVLEYNHTNQLFRGWGIKVQGS